MNWERREVLYHAHRASRLVVIIGCCLRRSIPLWTRDEGRIGSIACYHRSPNGGRSLVQSLGRTEETNLK
jgi:hypothetical protein